MLPSCEVASGDETAAEETPSSSPSFESRVRDLVKKFEYSDKVADDFVKFIRPWRCEELSRKLSEARAQAKGRKISLDQLAKVEENIIDDLANSITNDITQASRDSDSFDLEKLMSGKKTQCLGFTQLVYIIGRSMDLDCRAILALKDVSGPLPPGVEHVCCFVGLSNGKAVMVDLRKIGASSKPFVFTEQYMKDGKVWKLRDPKNPYQIHPVIQGSDENGLIAMVYGNRSSDYYQKGQYDKSLKMCERALAISPSARTYRDRSIAFSHLNDHEKERSDIMKAVELDPNDAIIRCQYGKCLTITGEYRQAIEEFSKSLKIDPEQAQALLGRGYIYLEMGQNDKAIADFTYALRTDPQNIGALCNRANAYCAMGQDRLALEDYDRCISANPKESRAYIGRGVLMIKMKMTDKAIADFTIAISNDPKNDDYYHKRGFAFSQMGQREKALVDLSKAIELAPRKIGAYLNRGGCYVEIRQFDKAIADFAKILEIDPKNADAYTARGFCYKELDRMEQALADMNRALEIDPKLVLGYINRGHALAKIGKSAEAKKDFQQAVKLQPGLKPSLQEAAKKYSIEFD
jgi:tetratricopeptide (TPR) repeat protein